MVDGGATDPAGTMEPTGGHSERQRRVACSLRTTYRESDFEGAVQHLTNQGCIPDVMEWVDGRGRSAYVLPPDGNVV